MWFCSTRSEENPPGTPGTLRGPLETSPPAEWRLEMRDMKLHATHELAGSVPVCRLLLHAPRRSQVTGPWQARIQRESKRVHRRVQKKLGPAEVTQSGEGEHGCGRRAAWDQGY